MTRTGCLALCILLVALILFPNIAQSQQHKEAFAKAKRTIENLTGKSFTEPVDIQPQSRKAFQKYLEQQLRSAYDEGELETFTTIYSLLGLLPNNYKLNEELLKLYKSQAGAYYDPQTGGIRTLGGDLPEAQAYFIYLHELVHAHQDQHYALLGEKRQRALESFDSMMAFNFVIEGHANLLTMSSQLGVSQLTDEYFTGKKHLNVFRLLTRFTSIDLSQFDFLEQLAGSSQLTQNIKMMKNTPDILIKQMIDPYFWGQFYWYERASRSSWNNSLRWLSDPPSRTRTIIYRGDSSGKTTARPPRYDSTYSESMGVYFLLRWLGKLDKRPAWGQALTNDRLHVIETRDDTHLSWAFRFEEAPPANRFFRSFSPEKAQEAGNDTYTVELSREHGTVFLTVQQEETAVVLHVEDDPDRETYDGLR